MGVAYWRPLLAFFRESLIAHGTIDAADLDRIVVTDDVAEAVATVLAGARKHLGERIVAQRKPSRLFGERGA
jgi:hypothetical protein